MTDALSPCPRPGDNSRDSCIDGDCPMNLMIQCEREDDGRWLAEVPELAGVLTYGPSSEAAAAAAQILALRVLADRLEHDEA